MIWPVVVGIVAAVAWWVRRGLMVITVDGSSMSPTYESGDRVLIRRGRRALRRGAVIVVAHPDVTTGWRHNAPLRGRGTGGWYIKRLAALAGDPYPPLMNRTGVVPDGTVVILGDNARSLDSRLHGPCPRHQILGVVVRRMGAPQRRRTGRMRSHDA